MLSFSVSIDVRPDDLSPDCLPVQASWPALQIPPKRKSSCEARR